MSYRDIGSDGCHDNQISRKLSRLRWDYQGDYQQRRASLYILVLEKGSNKKAGRLKDTQDSQPITPCMVLALSY